MNDLNNLDYKEHDIVRIVNGRYRGTLAEIVSINATDDNVIYRVRIKGVLRDIMPRLLPKDIRLVSREDGAK